jgi:hypothetical protein
MSNADILKWNSLALFILYAFRTHYGILQAKFRRSPPGLSEPGGWDSKKNGGDCVRHHAI